MNNDEIMEQEQEEIVTEVEPEEIKTPEGLTISDLEKMKNDIIDKINSLHETQQQQTEIISGWTDYISQYIGGDK